MKRANRLIYKLTFGDISAHLKEWKWQITTALIEKTGTLCFTRLLKFRFAKIPKFSLWNSQYERMIDNSMQLHQVSQAIKQLFRNKLLVLEQTGQSRMRGFCWTHGISFLLTRLSVKDDSQRWTKELMCVGREIHTCVYTPHTDRSRYTTRCWAHDASHFCFTRVSSVSSHKTSE